MTALFFLCLTACIFMAVVFSEADRASQPLRFGSGLVGWITSGNWPAKVGAGLLVIGLGALLRFALLNVDIDASLKLASGVASSLALFFVAHFVYARVHRREIAIAIAGAAFGVAYLTAYSAYALFAYLTPIAALAALSLVATSAGIYSVVRKALSVAILAMLGAFLAPAFALQQASPQIVYGYYLGISQLILLMVALRGWRPLIHLSFLFTLGGGLFFAWTSGFYSSQHFSTMQPLLLALIAVHVAMPLCEQRTKISGSESGWQSRFDSVYFLILPLTGAILLSIVAPTALARSNSMFMLAGLWSLATVVIRTLRMQGAGRHAAVGALLLSAGLYIRMPDGPWLLIGEAVAAFTLLLADRLRLPRTGQHIAVTVVLLFGLAALFSTIPLAVSGSPFFNRVVLERILAASLLILSGIAVRTVDHPMRSMLNFLGSVAVVNIVVAELFRWDIASWPLILHIGLIAACFAGAIVARRRPVAKEAVVALTIAVGATALWPAEIAAPIFALLMIAAPVALITMSLRSTEHEADYSKGNRIMAMLGAPILAWIWAHRTGEAIGIAEDQFALSVAAVTVFASTFALRVAGERSEGWVASVQIFFAAILAVVLGLFTLCFIQRGVWPISMELLCLAGLAQLTFVASNRSDSRVFGALTGVGAALVAQAMLLRALGPEGILTALDLFDLSWPAVISLFWAALGAALTLTARRWQSRGLWSVGASLLIGCAVKLVLFDFSSLGQLTNILAVIAAGLLFLLVSWIAPIPPKLQVANQT